MQNKTNKQQIKSVAPKATKKAQATEQPKARLEDKITEMLEQASKADKLIKVQKVTGYTSVKYGNNVLFEFHNKKKSISHLTFSNKQEAYKILEDNKLVHRVVPNSYGWKYNTECFLTDDFMKYFPAILKSVIAEAVAERNLKQVPKKAEKKVVKA